MIRAKSALQVKHPLCGRRWSRGIDAPQKTVDNLRRPASIGLQSGRSENNLSTMSFDLWQRGCEQLALELPEQQFNTWIRPLPAAEMADAGEVVLFSVRVPNRFKLDWIRTQYANRIEALLTELAGKPARLELTLAPREAAPARAVGTAQQPMRAAALLNLQGLAPSTSVRPGQAANAPSAPVGHSLAPAATTHKLKTELTFDTLVAGRANQMARTAALHVAGAPGVTYNPLFIYGGVGLGKTHLIHAVGNALLKDRPDARVLYLHADQFISDVVKNYQRKTFDELKSKYHSLDLLLISVFLKRITSEV